VKTVLGLFEYAVMVHGLKGACAFFQKMVNEVYVGLRFTGENEVENVCAVMAAYLDDLAVGSDSAAEHLVDLEAVLKRTRGAGLYLGSGRCSFLVIVCLIVWYDRRTTIRRYLRILRNHGMLPSSCVSLVW
jgi:hypothetical protein